MQMCLQSLEWHLQEVSRCPEEKPGDVIQSWRNGNREYWPSPDGYPYQFESTIHLRDGELTVSGGLSYYHGLSIQAEDFAMNAVIPEHFFMGEYDLVYRWDGKIKIVDLKASTGNNFRSEDYVTKCRCTLCYGGQLTTKIKSLMN